MKIGRRKYDLVYLIGPDDPTLTGTSGNMWTRVLWCVLGCACREGVMRAVLGCAGKVRCCGARGGQRGHVGPSS